MPFFHQFQAQKPMPFQLKILSSFIMFSKSPGTSGHSQEINKKQLYGGYSASLGICIHTWLFEAPICTTAAQLTGVRPWQSYSSSYAASAARSCCVCHETLKPIAHSAKQRSDDGWLAFPPLEQAISWPQRAVLLKAAFGLPSIRPACNLVSTSCGCLHDQRYDPSIAGSLSTD